MRDYTVIAASPDATRSLGERLGGAMLASNAAGVLVVALSGELGAGKTTFVGGVLRGMGVSGPIRSPTYTLIEPYEGVGVARDRNVYHLDLYRLERAVDLDMLALRDLLQPGSVLLTEWAERGERVLPIPDISISIHYPLGTDSSLVNSRNVIITAHSAMGETLADKLVAEPC